MKTIVSLAVALAAIPVGASIAAPTDPAVPDQLVAAVLPDPPPVTSAADLRSRVDSLSARVRVRAVRLGLTRVPAVRPAVTVEALAAQQQRLARLLSFLGQRHEVSLAVDERPAVPERSGASLGSHPLGRAYDAVVRQARRLGLDRPAAPRLATGAEARDAQVRAWRALARWLAGRSEVIRPDERPLSERIPHYAEWMCIAGHESKATWDISTGNGYYGGLQMDRQFQQTYAPGLYRTKGTADHWTAEEQMRAAERALPSRGFWPWPNTARMCGLI